MRITELSRFPHPVLSPGSGDFASGEFDIEFIVDENPTSGALSVDYAVQLTHASIRVLVESGAASVGIFVSCEDTFFRELRALSWPAGRTDFAAGSLLNRVLIRPLVWLTAPLDSWNPADLHHEFNSTINLPEGSVVAIGAEYQYSVGLAKLATLESIFELKPSDVSPAGIKIDPDGDRIQIYADKKTYDAICLLRTQRGGLATVMNGVYLPAVMELLDILRDGSAPYVDRRWHAPFTAKCDALGINLEDRDASVLERAQLLLQSPSGLLVDLTSGMEGD
jgi:hypothetical protein